MPSLSKAAYTKLVRDISRLLATAKSHRSVDSKLVQTYWTVGSRLVGTGVLDNAAYGDSVLKSLSQDLDIDERTLQRSVVFFREYEELPDAGLSWAHYRELLTLSDPNERRFYEELALDQQLSRDRLRLAIESDVYSSKTRPKRRARIKRPDEPRYLFEVQLLRVVDGDTLLVAVDVGFEVVKQQRLRLSRVNAFSAESSKGRQATRFVAERLAFADRIVVKTHRADLHGRYLAHVLYSTRQLGFLETFHRGHYLGQELLAPVARHAHDLMGAR